MKDGKLFGKINIIDLLVILLVAAAAVFLGIRLGERNAVGTPSTPTTSRIQYEVKVTRMEPELYDAIKARIDAGETQLLAGEALFDGYVTGIRAVPYVNTVSTDDGRYVVAEDPYYLNVYFTVEAAVSNALTNLVATQETRLGASIWVKTVGFQCVGTVTSLETIG